MARIEAGPLGKFRGAIGSIVGRIRYGKHHIALRQHKIKISKSKGSVDNRSEFSRNHHLTHIIREHKQLKEFWDKVNADGVNGYTRLQKRNLKLMQVEDIPPECGFTPPGDLIEITDFKIDDLEVEFGIKLNRSKQKYLKPPYDVYSLLILTDADRPPKDNIMGSLLKTQTIAEENPDGINHISLSYPSNLWSYKKYFSKMYIMIAIIKFNELKQKYEYSNTYLKRLHPKDL